MDEQTLAEIKAIFDGLQRFREARLEEKFTEHQKSIINSFQGETFKERFFRAAGLGNVGAAASPLDM